MTLILALPAALAPVVSARSSPGPTTVGVNEPLTINVGVRTGQHVGELEGRKAA